MAERTVVDLVEDWQTGFFLILGSVVAGIVTAVAVSSVTSGGTVALAAFVGGAVLAFLAFSYLLYGR